MAGGHSTEGLAGLLFICINRPIDFRAALVEPRMSQIVRKAEVERQTLRIKRDLSLALSAVMQEKGFTQNRLANRMETSRSVVYRLLSAKRDSINLRSLARIATILEIELTLGLDAE